MSEIVAIICPSGNQCSFLLPLLHEKKRFKLRLAAHSKDSAAKLQTQYPKAEVQICDITSLDACRSLLRGATSVYHIGPSFHTREEEMGYNVIDAAVLESQRPGNVFAHFVLSSVLATQLRALAQHDLKSRVEERLLLSPLNWTVLQPTNYMDHYPIAALAGAERPVVERMWDPLMANSVVSLRDLGEAGAKVLEEREKHYFAQYPLASTMPVSDADVVAAISRRIGKDIELKVLSFETAVNNLMGYVCKGAVQFSGNGSGSSESVVDGETRPDIVRDKAEKLVTFYRRRGLRGSPNVLRWLLGHDTMSVDQYVELEMQAAGL
ncbi:putative nucleoside-diphosphate-sugar epimerase [Xylariaceae sp. FL0016]|nr:putative nucleoside-diphosphate-sugar epimerase [Xylariaceae sp. FL0016]